MAPPPSTAAAPALGALGLTFTAMRIMQALCLLTIIGLSAKFISEAVDGGYVAPAPMLGTLIVSCIATVYIAINYILYYDSMLPLLVATAADLSLLITLIVVTVLVGKPISYLSCAKHPSSSGNPANFISSIYTTALDHSSSSSNIFPDPDRTACYELKAVWGLSIALCVFFTMSAITSSFLWWRLRKPVQEKQIE